MRGGWYLFNFMVLFSLSNDKRWLGLQQEPNPVCLTHTTSHTDYSRTVCGRDLAWTLTVSIIFLYKQVSLLVLLSSQTVTYMLPDEMCDRRQQRCESSKKRTINSDQWVQVKNKKPKTLTKQNTLLTQLLGNWSRKIYAELFRQYLYCSSLRIYICFPRNKKAGKNLWYSETIRVQILTFIKMSKCLQVDFFFF